MRWYIATTVLLIGLLAAPASFAEGGPEPRDPTPLLAASPAVAPLAATAPPPVPAPRPRYGDETMRSMGIGVTALGIASVPIGLGLLFAQPLFAGYNDPILPGSQSCGGCQMAGIIVLSVGPTILPAIGIPLWVNGAKPAKSDARANAVSWSVAPLALPPLRTSAGRAPASPGGVAIVGAF